MLAQVRDSIWLIVTPDMHISAEDLSSENGDIVGLDWSPTSGSTPGVFKRGTGYRFGRLSANERLALIEQGDGLVAAERLLLDDVMEIEGPQEEFLLVAVK
jgi:hypothetical protein